MFIDFWASWCPPCRAAAPKVEELYTHFSGRDDVAIIGINLDQNENQATKFIREQGMGYLVLKGGSSDVSRAYGVQGIPAFFLIDAKGKIVKQYTGYRPGIEMEWRQEIEKLLK